MAPSTLERKDVAWLEGHAHEWIAAGLVSDEQVAAIRHFEHLDEPAAPQRLTLVAEVASYLGSVIAFVGGAVIIGPNWERLGMGGQLALAFAIVAVGFGIGTWLVHLAETGTERLGSFLWMVGSGGLAMAAAVVMNEIDPRDGEWFAIVIGLPLLAIGLGLWRNLDRPLQLITAVVGFGVAFGGIGGLTDVSMWVAAPLVWMIGAVFGAAAAAGRVRPRLVALAIAAVGVMVGAMMFGEVSQDVSAVVAMSTAALVVAYALHDGSLPLLAIGMVEFFIATMAMMQTLLVGMLPRLVAVLVGLAVVTYVALRAQRMGRGGPTETAV
jgi:hypothetical protein